MEKQACTTFHKKLNDKEQMTFIVSNTIPAGIVHDFVMEIKGHCVDVMVQAHKAHEEEVKQQDCEDKGCDSDGS
tara:strand:+ start:456 stop:677 length:222 start_codon:yes stop_codon:yes gene_type:complete